MKNRNKFAFTLAEVMIVLSIIGILSAILLPTAFHATPDKNILKFKKAYNDFAVVIRELVSSGKYFTPGDLSLYPDGTKIDTTDTDNYFYFCESFADIVSTKSVECDKDYGNAAWGYDYSECHTKGQSEANHKSGLENKLYWYDYMCNREKDSSGYIVTNNDVYIANHSPQTTYHPMDYSTYALALEEGDDYINCTYKLICIDIDGPSGPTKPFGIGIRPDGKLKLGARARWWVNRDITKKETDCCPKALSTYSSGSLCDDNDTICTE